MVLGEIVVTKCVDRATHALVIRNTNSASWYTYQQNAQSTSYVPSARTA
jgi:hypothetical protein